MHLAQPARQVSGRVAAEEGPGGGQGIPAAAGVCLRRLVPPCVADRRYGLLPGVEGLVAAGVWSRVPGRCRRRERRLSHPGGRQRRSVGGHVDQVRRRRGDQQQRGQAIG